MFWLQSNEFLGFSHFSVLMQYCSKSQTLNSLFLPIHSGCHSGMLFKVARKERLVGEVQLKSDFLHTFVRSAELHLDFLDATYIDKFFGRMSGQVLYDRRQVASGDAHLVGIKLHLAVCIAMLEYQSNKFLQQCWNTKAINFSNSSSCRVVFEVLR